MKEQGVRQDDPEFLKAHNLLTAISYQQQLARQKQAYAQQQQQAQHRHPQQQQNGGNSQPATNGINGNLSITPSHTYLIDRLSQDVLHKLRSPLPPQTSNPQPVLVRPRRHSPPLLRLAQLLVRNPENSPQLAVPVSAPNNCRCFGIKFWHSNYCPKILPYHPMSNSNSLLRSKPNDLLLQFKRLQQLIKSSSKRLKLEVVRLGKMRDPRNYGHGLTLSRRLTSTCLRPSATQITGTEAEGP